MEEAFECPPTPSADPDGFRTCPFEGCTKRFAKVGHMNRHMRQHTGDRPFACTICGRDFGRSEHLRRHVLAHGTGSRRFSCRTCEESFFTDKELKQHELTHDAKPVKCSFIGCDASFRFDSELKYHEATHYGGKLKCPVESCSASFQFESQLKRHADSVHREEHIFVCGEIGCKEKFKFQKDLTSHLMTEHKDSVLSCDLCMKIFSSKEKLSRHMQTHSSSRKLYECQYEGCTKTFVKKSGLRAHIDSQHLNLRPFVCSFESCGKSFTLKCILDKHELSHLKKRDAPDSPSSAATSSTAQPTRKRSRKVQEFLHELFDAPTVSTIPATSLDDDISRSNSPDPFAVEFGSVDAMPPIQNQFLQEPISLSNFEAHPKLGTEAESPRRDSPIFSSTTISFGSFFEEPCTKFNFINP